MAQHPFRYSLLCGAALLAMTPGLAQATVVVTGTFANQNAGNFGDGTGSVAVTVNEFNPATEGALSGIVITLTTSATDSSKHRIVATLALHSAAATSVAMCR